MMPVQVAGCLCASEGVRGHSPHFVQKNHNLTRSLAASSQVAQTTIQRPVLYMYTPVMLLCYVRLLQHRDTGLECSCTCMYTAM